MATWRNVIRQLDLQSDPNRVISTVQAIQKVAYDSPVVDAYAYASLVKACSKLTNVKGGKSVHCRVLKIGYDGNLNVRNSLIHFYASLEIMNYARELFDEMPERTVVTVNGMLSGFLKSKRFDEGFRLFNEEFRDGLMPNYVTMVILVSGCVEISQITGGYRLGKLLHALCCKTRLDCELEVGNVLIDFYAKFGCVDDAVRVFNGMKNKDLVSWNTMIAGYGKNGGSLGKAFSLFREMRNNGEIGYDRVSLVNLSMACAYGRDAVRGKMVHGHMIVTGESISLSAGTVLINMYSKCGLVGYATRVFWELPGENVASWNSMIHGYVGSGRNVEALVLFDSMKLRKIAADEVTMLGVIAACRNSGELSRGVEIHSFIDADDSLNGRVILRNALVDMYAKCGSMDRARAVFDTIPCKDVISWTTIIVGHAINGEGEGALIALNQMCDEGIKPNFVTFIGVLSACNHSGLVEVGQKLYDMMIKIDDIEPRIEHYGCMIDMFARAGMLEEAKMFMERMPVEPSSAVWRMLVNACRVHGNTILGLSSVANLLEGRKSIEDRVVCANVFAMAERWNEVLQERSAMVAQNDAKVAGKSSIVT
ncbi:Pentatricopeptide repeat-containing protein At4g33990 [Linum perenne]